MYKLNRHRSPTKVAKWTGNVASGIPNMWSFWTPCLQVTWHGVCAVNVWPWTWANASLRLCISLTVQDSRMVSIDHQVSLNKTYWAFCFNKGNYSCSVQRNFNKFYKLLCSSTAVVYITRYAKIYGVGQPLWPPPCCDGACQVVFSWPATNP